VRRVVYPIIVAAVGHLVMIGVAAVVLPGVEVGYLWDLVACALLTTSVVAVREVVARRVAAPGRARAWTWGLALVAVASSLVVTTFVAPSDGFAIEGAGSWAGAVPLAWLVTPLYEALARRGSRRRPAAAAADRRRTVPPSGTGEDARPPYAGGTAGGTLPPGPPREMPRLD
jgi:hypothetical protein